MHETQPQIVLELGRKGRAFPHWAVAKPQKLTNEAKDRRARLHALLNRICTELHLSRFHVGDALFEAGRINLVGFAFCNRHVGCRQRFLLPSRGPEQIGFGR